jgi:hypothetical protein
MWTAPIATVARITKVRMLNIFLKPSARVIVQSDRKMPLRVRSEKPVDPLRVAARVGRYVDQELFRFTRPQLHDITNDKTIVVVKVLLLVLQVLSG